MSAFMRKLRSDKSRPGSTNYLASVSDMMSGLLIVFILALVATMVQTKLAEERAVAAQKQALEKARQAELKAKQLEAVQKRLGLVEARLTGNDQARRGLLNSIQSRLRKDFQLDVNTDLTKGVLRIPESAVTFSVGRSDLDASNTEKLNAIGRVLKSELLCYEHSYWTANTDQCRRKNPTANLLDAVFIEGHTDNQVFREDPKGLKNLILSTARSSTVYQILVLKDPELRNLKNEKGEMLFSVSGYGPERPVPGHDHATPTDDSANRRIELRFIFTEPKLSDQESSLLVNPTVQSPPSTADNGV